MVYNSGAYIRRYGVRDFGRTISRGQPIRIGSCVEKYSGSCQPILKALYRVAALFNRLIWAHLTTLS